MNAVGIWRLPKGKRNIRIGEAIRLNPRSQWRIVKLDRETIGLQPHCSLLKWIAGQHCPTQLDEWRTQDKTYDKGDNWAMTLKEVFR